MSDEKKIVSTHIETTKDGGNWYKQKVIGVCEDGSTKVISSMAIHKDELGKEGYRKD